MDMVSYEVKREKFKKIAGNRVETILQKIETLGNCSNRRYYEYTEDEIDKIFNTLDKKLKETKSLFRFNKKERFSL
jgi:protein tyrosine/serine phosphatase